MVVSKVYVGNLDFKVTEAELERVMQEAGPVSSVTLAKSGNGNSKGFAIVEYSDSASAEKAISQLKDRQLGQRPIMVREDRGPAEPRVREPRAPRAEAAEQREPRAPRAPRAENEQRERRPRAPRVSTDSGDVATTEEKTARPRQPRIAPLRVRPEDKGRLLYVGNIPWRASWQDLKDLFRDVGEVIRVDIPMDREGRSRGYATVLFETEAAAVDAIKRFNDHEFEGRRLIVREDQYVERGSRQTEEQ
jgi:RNA recognition motif-containing protein